MEQLYFESFESPVGYLTVFATEKALTAVRYLELNDSVPNDLTREARRQLEDYFARKRRIFDLPLEFSGTEFQQRVWKALLDIPYGETLTYGQLAEKIGCRGGARAVGSANSKNSLPIIVPCHRVVASGGDLGGYTPSLAIKKTLLDLERG